jgi:PPP family 3-phenylpropionic acid transporter
VLDVLPSRVVLWVVFGLLTLVLWSVWHLPDTDVPHGSPPPPGAARALLTSRPVLLFYAVCLLMQASHGAYYGFYSVYLDGLGYSRGAIGALWALGVGAEVVVLAGSGAILSAVGTRRMILLSLALTVLRWGILANVTHPAWLFCAQLLHAASFGLFHVAAVTYTHRIMPARLRATGQSLYSSLSFGLGLTVAIYLCGLFYARVGAHALFAASALVALCAGLLAIGLKPSPERAKAAG